MRIQSVNNNYQNKNKNKQSFGMVKLPDGNLTTYEAIFGAMCGANIAIGTKTIIRNGKKLSKDVFLVETINDTIWEDKVIKVAKRYLQIKNPRVIKDEEAKAMIDTYNRAHGLRTGITPFDFERMGFDDPL